jgi:hypothetical protein
MIFTLNAIASGSGRACDRGRLCNLSHVLCPLSSCSTSFSPLAFLMAPPKNTPAHTDASDQPNVLYAIGVPKAVTWASLEICLKLCGTVKSTSTNESARSPGRTWRLEFESISKGVYEP